MRAIIRPQHEELLAETPFANRGCESGRANPSTAKACRGKIEWMPGCHNTAFASDGSSAFPKRNESYESFLLFVCLSAKAA